MRKHSRQLLLLSGFIVVGKMLVNLHQSGDFIYNKYSTVIGEFEVLASNSNLLDGTTSGHPSVFQEMFQLASQWRNNHSQTLQGNHTPREDFDLQLWIKQGRNGTGGLTDLDREKVGQIYRNASSLFEYGLGESTFIANHVGVPRYAGIDSDPVWVNDTRQQVASHYRSYLADIGETELWGYPKDRQTEKAALNYQLAPLMSEIDPFDVYMVDGRYRLACLAASFIHASHRGMKASPIAILHDCEREYYHTWDHLFDVELNQGKVRKACVYRRKTTTTDEQLKEMWLKHAKDNS